MNGVVHFGHERMVRCGADLQKSHVTKPLRVTRTPSEVTCQRCKALIEIDAKREEAR